MKERLRIISEEFFLVSFILFVVLMIVEITHRGFVARVFNLNYLLLPIFASAVIFTLTRTFGLKEEVSSLMNGISEKNLYVFLTVSFLPGVFTFWFTQSAGFVSIFLGLVVAAITFTLFLIIKEG